MADIFKLRNLGDEELQQQERLSTEQLFRLRFQMKLGQNEGAKKMRELRRTIACIRTVQRERELGLKRGEGLSRRRTGTRLADRAVEAPAAEAQPAGETEAAEGSGE